MPDLVPSPPLAAAAAVLGLDTLLWTHARLFVSDLLHNIEKLDTLQGIWSYQTHPIKKVQIAGIVAGREERLGKYRTILLDDGTGVIPCVQWTQDMKTADGDEGILSLGSLVRVRGRITEFRGIRQITVDEIFLEPNFNYEYLRWLEVIDLKQSIYNIPFKPPSNLPLDELLASESSDAHNLPNNQHDNGLLQHAKRIYESAKKEGQRPDARDEQLKEAIRWFMEVCAMDNGVLVVYEVIKQELMSVAENVILQQYKSENQQVTTSRINSAFGRALGSLVEEGFIYHQDMHEDVFEVIKPESNLSAYILKILENETSRRVSSAIKGKAPAGGASLAADGISLDIIVFELRSPKCPFSRCSLNMIREAMRYLVGTSDVYEISPDHYKIIAL